MSPATVAGTRPTTRQGRADREKTQVIEAIREWVGLYGEPPRAADWNPSSARWCGQDWRADRYRQGRPDGRPWPSLNAAKRPFDGKLTAAVRAAGYEPGRPGPTRRANVTVDHTDRLPAHPDVRVALDAARAQARDAAERLTARDRQLDRARSQIGTLQADLAAARRARKRVGTVKTRVVRERVVDGRALARAEARAMTLERQLADARTDAKTTVAEAKMDAAEARRAASRSAGKLERAEGTISTIRAEKRELKRTLDAAEDRAVAANRALEAERAENETLRAAPARTVVRDAPEQTVLDEALAAARRARSAIDEAEIRAARAERDYRELAAAATGSARRLTPVELAELRASGPSGPALLAAALTALARARKTNNPDRLKAALTAVASASVSWRDRLR